MYVCVYVCMSMCVYEYVCTCVCVCVCVLLKSKYTLHSLHAHLLYLFIQNRLVIMNDVLYRFSTSCLIQSHKMSNVYFGGKFIISLYNCFVKYFPDRHI